MENLGHRTRSRLLETQLQQRLPPANGDKCHEGSANDQANGQANGHVLVNGQAQVNDDNGLGTITATINGDAPGRSAAHVDATNGAAAVDFAVNGTAFHGLTSNSNATINGNGNTANGFTGNEARASNCLAQNGVHEATQSLETNGTQDGLAHTVSKPKLLVLSASDEDGILRQARDLRAVFECSRPTENHDEILHDISFTLNTRRTLLDWKSYSVVSSLAEISDLKASLSSATRKVADGTPRLGFVFTGQGAQWPKMGFELLTWPVFRASLERSQDYLTAFGCTWSLFGESPSSIRRMPHEDQSEVV